MKLKPILKEDKSELPCRFYDMPGIDRKKTIDKNIIERILKGELNMNVCHYCNSIYIHHLYYLYYYIKIKD